MKNKLILSLTLVLSAMMSLPAGNNSSSTTNATRTVTMPFRRKTTKSIGKTTTGAASNQKPSAVKK